jgi:hypothetical protein
MIIINLIETNACLLQWASEGVSHCDGHHFYTRFYSSNTYEFLRITNLAHREQKQGEKSILIK